jgi:predicted aspartyl protease
MDNQIQKYDRIYGNLIDVSLSTKPSTVKVVQPLTARAETFIIQTVRHDENGDYIFVECADEGGLVRLVLPPKVANAIAAQRESLTKRRRSIASRAAMKQRMARGEVINFKKKSRGK